MQPNQPITRRRALHALGLVGGGAVLGACSDNLLQPEPAAASASLFSQGRTGGPPIATDADLFNFALNLEYLETEYYLRATTGSGIPEGDAGPNPGEVLNAPGGPVNFSTPAFAAYARELAANELAHVRYYREVLGERAVSRPTLDLSAFAAAAEAAGLGSGFNPFANEINFFLGGFLLEDVGVTAYKGGARMIRNPNRLEDWAGILAVESYHMGMARSLLFEAGTAAQQAANAISAARDSLDGPEDLDQPISIDGRANFVPSDERGIAFSRTPSQVLRIVYLTPKQGVSGGGFYPKGLNGAISTT